MGSDQEHGGHVGVSNRSPLGPEIGRTRDEAPKPGRGSQVAEVSTTSSTRPPPPPLGCRRRGRRVWDPRAGMWWPPCGRRSQGGDAAAAWQAWWPRGQRRRNCPGFCPSLRALPCLPRTHLAQGLGNATIGAQTLGCRAGLQDQHAPAAPLLSPGSSKGAVRLRTNPRTLTVTHAALSDHP